MGWFALVNVALLALVGLRYLWYYARLTPSTGWIYVLIAFLGHMGALACLSLLLLLPLTLLIPRPQVIVPLGLLSSAEPWPAFSCSTPRSSRGTATTSTS